MFAERAGELLLTCIDTILPSNSIIHIYMVNWNDHAYNIHIGTIYYTMKYEWHTFKFCIPSIPSKYNIYISKIFI